jgi:pyroglutamyl-peptidase
VPVNATMALVPELAGLAARHFPDVGVFAEVLATEWVAGPQRLDLLLAQTDPDIALHFGVSARARGFEIEARACNLRAASPDAAGALPPAAHVRVGAPEHLRASLPAARIVTRLRLRGIPAFVSRDAGGYLCNATLYHSLACARDGHTRRVGFVHIPASLARPGGANRGRAGACPLTWAQAVDGALEILATCLGRTMRHDRPTPALLRRLRASSPGTT